MAHGSQMEMEDISYIRAQSPKSETQNPRHCKNSPQATSHTFVFLIKAHKAAKSRASRSELIAHCSSFKKRQVSYRQVRRLPAKHVHPALHPAPPAPPRSLRYRALDRSGCLLPCHTSVPSLHLFCLGAPRRSPRHPPGGPHLEGTTYCISTIGS
jgi:hypothetical protein